MQLIGNSSMLTVAVAASSSAVIIADALRPGFPMVYVNPAFERLTGRSADDVIGHSIRSLIVDGDDDPQLAELETALSDGRECVLTLRQRRLDGTRMWLETRVSPVHDAAGQLTSFIVVQQDVSDRVNAEIEAQKRSTELNLLYEAARQIGTSLDPVEIYDTAYRLIASVMDCDQFVFSDFDPLERMVRCRYAIVKGSPVDVSNLPPARLSEDRTRGTQSLVIYSGRSLYMADYRAHLLRAEKPVYYSFDGQMQSAEAAIAADIPPRSALLVPLTLEGQVTGVIQIHSFRSDAYTEQNLRFVETLATHVASANNNALLYANVQAELAERKRAEAAEQEQRVLAEALRDTASVLSSSLDLPTVMHHLLEYAGRVKPNDAANIMIIEGQEARITYMRGYRASAESFIRGRLYPLTLPSFDYMVRTGLPAVISDTGRHATWVSLPEPPFVRSCLMTPLRIRNQVIGFLSLDSYTPDFFTEADLGRMQAIADQAAMALENAQLYAQIQEHANRLEERVVARTVELKRTAERLKVIFDSSSDAIAIVDLDGSVRAINNAFEDMVGCPVDQLHLLPLWDVIAQGSPESLLGSLRRVAATRERERLEMICGRADGGRIVADVTFTWIPDADPGAGMILCNFHDITRRKQAETELRQRLEQERQLNELKARFTSMVSHEFRTPLAIIQSSSDILKLYGDQFSLEKRRSYLEKIQEQIRRLSVMQEEVLQLSRAETVGVSLKREPVQLVDLCRTLVEEFQQLAPRHRIAFISAGPGSELLLDARLIRDAISNLLSNGIKYSPDDSVVTLEIDCERDPATIAIQDRGIGIPSDDLPFVFDPFHRAANVEQREGTGLGLAIVKRAIEAHGGVIEVESEEGHGTVFTIRLPKALA